MAWSGTIPTRVGAPTIRRFLKIILRLLVEFWPVIQNYLDDDGKAAWQALQTAGNDFLEAVPHPREGQED